MVYIGYVDIVLQDSYSNMTSWCSGYHICLTGLGHRPTEHRRLPVRFRPKSVFFVIFIYFLDVCCLFLPKSIKESTFPEDICKKLTLKIWSIPLLSVAIFNIDRFVSLHVTASAQR